MKQQKYRLVTRSDFDGLVCAVLLNELDMIDEIKFVHPKDMQDGKVEITSRDITTNLPYVASAGLIFDHHLSETIRNPSRQDNYIIDPSAPSTARVVYDYCGGRKAFPKISEAMMDAVDKADSAQFTRDEILDPKGWVLLSYLMDARTGLGRFHDFRVSNYTLMMDLIKYCRNHGIDGILELPDVKERVDLYFAHAAPAREQIQRCTTVHKKTAVLDLRHERVIHATNRFMIYALFPETDISIHVLWGVQRQNTVFAVGKSILDRGSPVNIGELMLKYGGGGHRAAGTCQIANDWADVILGELIAQIDAAGGARRGPE
jgi:nanoRNase/pAp phosphatase (c-di-AMP/oligoRNAs hydrolase)